MRNTSRPYILVSSLKLLNSIDVFSRARTTNSPERGLNGLSIRRTSGKLRYLHWRLATSLPASYRSVSSRSLSPPLTCGATWVGVAGLAVLVVAVVGTAADGTGMLATTPVVRSKVIQA